MELPEPENPRILGSLSITTRLERAIRIKKLSPTLDGTEESEYKKTGIRFQKIMFVYKFTSVFIS